MLYFLKTEEYYKIGYTKDSGLESRLRLYATHNPLVELIGIKEGTIEDEQKYHVSFSNYEGTGEWFKLPKSLVDVIKKDFVPCDLLKHPNKRGIDSKNKKYYKKKRGKILQYSLNGELLKEFTTIREASKETKIGYWRIWRCINGETTNADNFVWRLEKI